MPSMDQYDRRRKVHRNQVINQHYTSVFVCFYLFVCVRRPDRKRHFFVAFFPRLIAVCVCIQIIPFFSCVVSIWKVSVICLSFWYLLTLCYKEEKPIIEIQFNFDKNSQYSFPEAMAMRKWSFLLLLRLRITNMELRPSFSSSVLHAYFSVSPLDVWLFFFGDCLGFLFCCVRFEFNISNTRTRVFKWKAEQWGKLTSIGMVQMDIHIGYCMEFRRVFKLIFGYCMRCHQHII